MLTLNCGRCGAASDGDLCAPCMRLDQDETEDAIYEQFERYEAARRAERYAPIRHLPGNFRPKRFGT